MGQIDHSRLLTTVNPVLAAEWHLAKNTALSLTGIYANSGKKAWWQCSTCDYEWEAVIASRNSAGRGCPRCAGKIATSQNSLISLHPHIAADYDHERNTKPVELITAVSHYKAWWKCSVNSDHSWQAMVMNRVRQGDGCPYCSGRYATSTNNLATVRPDLASEFDLIKNAPLTPYTITPKTPKNFWWVCSEGHSYQRSLNARNGPKNSGCWQCKSVAFLHPHLVSEWDYEKNLKAPEEVFASSTSIKIWWKCRAQHLWQAIPASRTRTGRESGCPDCIRSQTSAIEDNLRAGMQSIPQISDLILTQNAEVPGLRDSNNRKYRVDVLATFKGKPIIIEWDSWYWHADIAHERKISSYARDTKKTKELIEHGCYVVRLRESTNSASLMPLQLDNPRLLQLSYNYNAKGRSFQDFYEIFEAWLRTL